MDETTVFPQPINHLIDSYVDMRQALAEQPSSLMFRCRDQALRLLQHDLEFYRSNYIRAKLMTWKERARRGRRQRLRLDDSATKTIHRIKCAIRFFKQRDVYYIGKHFSGYVDNLDLTKQSEYIMQQRKTCTNEEWREFVQQLNTNPRFLRDPLDYFKSCPILSRWA